MQRFRENGKVDEETTKDQGKLLEFLEKKSKQDEKLFVY
jgi:hypothetical protein